MTCGLSRGVSIDAGAARSVVAPDLDPERGAAAAGPTTSQLEI
jgi:hypothetical protein